jgi:hypothetical protein
MGECHSFGIVVLIARQWLSAIQPDQEMLPIDSTGNQLFMGIQIERIGTGQSFSSSAGNSRRSPQAKGGDSLSNDVTDCPQSEWPSVEVQVDERKPRGWNAMINFGTSFPFGERRTMPMPPSHPSNSGS